MKYRNPKLCLLTLFLVCTATAAFGQSGDNQARVEQEPAGMILQIHQPASSAIDSMDIQAIDSATAARFWLQFQSARGKAKKQSSEHSFDQLAYMRKQIDTEQKQRTLTSGQLVRVRTTAGKGSEVVVHLENTSGKSLEDIKIHMDQLPDGWKSVTPQLSFENLSPGEERKQTFKLSGDALKEEIVGFTLQVGEGWNMGWTARVKLPQAGRQNEVPEAFKLHGNYPNPFNPTTTISYSLPEAMTVEIKIYNLQGQLVADFGKKYQQAGVQNVTWNAGALASGTYFYQLIAAGSDGREFIEQKTMVLIK
ncbi:MAG: T9SS type A sorting domain-containing protein [Gracilimonas sp.]|uniref:T9SS type A sorting domain-containing protein n=1 Tax=Gracilimonas sp. TaxID=1974203 RepID=UPI00374FF63C|nr:T9SS type A sorting domain-containing protein [Gracilimonas sp.]